jgi:hypothetical protein
MRPALAFILLLWVSCARPASEDAAARQAHAPTTETRAAPAGRRHLTALAAPAAPRIVAIGDLHGDLEATRKALRLAGAIDEHDRWVGGTLVVVQTGDVIDRGDDDRAVLDLLERLAQEAKAAGGALYTLAGNHELMNVAQDFRYVTRGSLPPFDALGGRANAFMPGGPYAKLLASRPLFMKVGDTVFVHAGILPKHVAYGLERMNDEVRAWMLGRRPVPPASVVAEDGPIWTRAYGYDPGPTECAQLDEVLRALGAKRMVVGHTPQEAGISSACDGRVFRIDVGMSRFYGGRVQVLDIQGDAVTPLRAD